MNRLEFSWDPEKEKMNRKKHGISFKEAQTVFHDVNGRIIHDPDHSEDEDRFILIGISSIHHILTVCHCYWARETIIRIISARKATKNEQNQYRRL